MKAFLLLVFFGLFSSNEGSSLYEISFESINGNTVNMSSFKGQRLVIVVFDSKRPDTTYLAFIDSLAKNDSASTAVIAVPATDLSNDSTDVPIQPDSALALLSARGMFISQAIPVKKSAGELQHPLFKWLTHVEQNIHFDRDVEQDGQLFMINEQGVLYGVHDKQLPAEAIKKVMTENIEQ